MSRRRPALLAAAVVVVLAAVGTVVVRSDDRGRVAVRPVSSSDQLDAAAAGGYFLAHYEEPDGKVVRWDQGADTVSEGEAYAMLVAVALGSRGRFSAAWSWSRSHLVGSDGLLSWRYAGGRVVGGSAAADADLDAAWALYLAGRRWSDTAWTTAARKLSSAILDHETERIDGATVLLAGPWAAGASPTLNPSYLSTAAMAALSALEGRWTSVESASIRFLGQLMARGHLPSDWAIVSGGQAHPTAPPGQAGAPVSYGFDAVRVPVLLASSCVGSETKLAASVWPALEREVSSGGPQVDLDLGASPQSDAVSAPVGLVGAAGAAAADGRTGTEVRLLDIAQFENASRPTYYGSAWVALGRILLQTHDLGTCPA